MSEIGRFVPLQELSVIDGGVKTAKDYLTVSFWFSLFLL